MLTLFTLLGCDPPTPLCVPLNDTAKHDVFIACDPDLGVCDYDVALTGGAFGVNNFVNLSPQEAVGVDAPGEMREFEFAGLQEVDEIWMEKTLRGCAPGSWPPCITAVRNVTVQPSCP